MWHARGMNTQNRLLVPEDAGRWLENERRQERKSLIRGITALALGSASRRFAADIAKSYWGEDSGAAAIVKAAVSPTGTGDFPAWQATRVLPSLAPSSAATRLFGMALRVSLENIATTKLSYSLAPPVALFVAEGGPAPHLQGSFQSVTLGPTKKLLALASVTGEIESMAAESASQIVARLLDDSVSKSLDSGVFSATAADASRPGGILVGATSVPPTAAGTITELALAAKDLSNLIGAITDAGINPSGVAFICNPREVVKLRLLAPQFETPILDTPAVPAKTIVAIATNAIASGYSGQAELEISKDATIHMEASAPQALLAAPTMSAWQTDTLVLKLRARVAWTVVPGAVALTQNVVW